VLLGQADPAPLDLDQIQLRLNRNQAARESLQYVGIDSAVDLFSNYTASAKDLQPWLADAQINSDMNLRLQYLAGMGVNFQNAPFIMQQIAQYQEYPEDFFEGSEGTIARLRRLLERYPY